MEINIRAFKIEDREAVVSLWQACSLVVPWNDPDKDIARKMKTGPDLFLVGEREGELVASVMGGYDGHRGWVNYLAVSPRHRRKGYARRMMAAVEHRLRRKGCPKINLQVRESNAGVIAFYNALGYRNDHVISLGKRLETDESA